MVHGIISLKNGIPTRNKWVGDYHLLADGKWRQPVDNYRYYVGANELGYRILSSKGNQKRFFRFSTCGYNGVEQFDSRYNTMVSICVLKE